MKTCHKLLLLIMLMFINIQAFSQNKEEAKTLVNQGVALNDSGKYAEAIEKYNRALKIDPFYQSAYYEMGYTLFSTGKGPDAIPFLIKLVALNPQSAEAFDMLGSIYDDMKEPDKAIDFYKQGIKADSTYQRLYFNIAITYYRQDKFTDAEHAAIKAVKLDPKHASSQRIYAMTAYKLKERGASLLAWCSFLLIEPQSKRSVEAYSYVKNILGYGVKWTGEKSVTLTINPNEGAANLLMPMAISTALDKKSNLSAVDSVQFQLTSLFEISTSIIGDKAPLEVQSYFANYFEKLSKSGNMPAFTRYISLSAYKDENLAWFKEHDKELKDLQQWISSTERNF